MAAVIVTLFLLEKPIERLSDRWLYAPWAYGDNRLTGSWRGSFVDGTPFVLTLAREQTGGIPTPTDSRAAVDGSAETPTLHWQLHGSVNRSGSDIELVLWQDSRDNVRGFLNGTWSGADLTLSGEIDGQSISLVLTRQP